MQFFNQFSYMVAVITFGLVFGFVVSRIPRLTRPLRLIILAGYVVIALIIGIAFHYPPSPVDAETIEEVEQTLTNENPTFLMLYSNY